MNEKVIKINEILQKGEPDNWSKDHKGYAGYKPQAVIDACNEAGLEFNLELIEYGTRSSGNTDKNNNEIIDAFAKVKLTIDGRFVESFASHPIIKDYGDAVKSAQTDAMKKAMAHFSIGSRAYHGLLTEGGSSKADATGL